MFAVCRPEQLTGKELVYVINCNLAAIFMVSGHKVFADSHLCFDVSKCKPFSLDIIRFLMLLLGMVFWEHVLCCQYRGFNPVTLLALALYFRFSTYTHISSHNNSNLKNFIANFFTLK